MLRVVFVVTLLLNLMACSSSPEWKGNYSEDNSEKWSGKLDVPPDLSQPDLTSNFLLPNIASDGSTYSAYKNTEYKGDKVAPASLRGIKVFRDGKNQWLEINATAEKLWPELRVFFTKVGFEIKREDKKIGIMETNWLENRVTLSDGFFSKILNWISSSGVRDKYRVRLEKTNKANVTRLFITHQGLQEKGSENSTGSGIKIWWERRPSDPELEAEMYQRFLIFRDMDKTSVKKLVAKIDAKERTKIIEKDGMTILQVGEGFDRTWRRVGIALDRIGLFVDDRNRSGGLYYLRITDDFKAKIKEEKNWLASLFSSNTVKLKERYLLRVADENDKTIISIYETSGAKPDIRLVRQFLTDLKSYLD